MEEIPCIHIRFSKDELSELGVNHYFELSVPFVYEKETKDELIRKGKKFIKEYEKYTVYAERWKKLLTRLES